MALYDPETWKLRNLKWKYLESFEIWCWTRVEKIKWAEKVTLKNRRRYWELKEEAEDRNRWKRQFINRT